MQEQEEHLSFTDLTVSYQYTILMTTWPINAHQRTSSAATHWDAADYALELAFGYIHMYSLLDTFIATLYLYLNKLNSVNFCCGVVGISWRLLYSLEVSETFVYLSCL